MGRKRILVVVFFCHGLCVSFTKFSARNFSFLAELDAIIFITMGCLFSSSCC